MWFKIIAPITALAIAFAAGWTIASWRASGDLEMERGRRLAAEVEASTTTAERDVCRIDLAAVKLDLTTKAEELADAQRLYDEATSRPPERVTVYRDRWREVPTSITGETCDESLGQLIAWIGTLPKRGVIHETPN